MVRTRIKQRKSYDITAMQKAERKRTNTWRKEAYAERQKTKTRRRKNRNAKVTEEKRLRAQRKKDYQERQLNNMRVPLLEHLVELQVLCRDRYGTFIHQERIDDLLDIHDHKSICDYMDFDEQCLTHLTETINSILSEEKDTSIEGLTKRYNNLLYKMVENVDLDTLSEEDRARYSNLILSN
jgi:hypothetical protein